MKVPIFQTFTRELVAQGVLSATELANLRREARQGTIDLAEALWHRVKDDPEAKERFFAALRAANVVVPEAVEPDPELYGMYAPETWQHTRAFPVRHAGLRLIATPQPFSPSTQQLQQALDVPQIAFVPPEDLELLQGQLEGSEDLAQIAAEEVNEIFAMPEIGFAEDGEPTREERLLEIIQEFVPPADLEGEAPDIERRAFDHLSPEQRDQLYRRFFEDWKLRPAFGEVLELRANLDGIALERPQNPSLLKETRLIPARTPSGDPVYLTYRPYAGELLENLPELEPRPFILVPPPLWERAARRAFLSGQAPRQDTLAEILASEGIEVPEEVLLRCERDRSDDDACAAHLAEAGVADDEAIARARALKYGLQYVNLGRTPPAEGLAESFDPALLHRLKALPHAYNEEERALYVAVADPRTDLTPLIARAPEGMEVEAVVPVVANERILRELLPPVPIERSPLSELIRQARERGAQRLYVVFRGPRAQLSTLPESAGLGDLTPSQIRDLEAEIRRLVGSGVAVLPIEGAPVIAAGEVRRGNHEELWAAFYLSPVPGTIPSDFHAAFARALRNPGRYLVRTSDPLALRAFLQEQAAALDRGRVLWVGPHPIPGERVVWVRALEAAEPLTHMPFAWAVVEGIPPRFPRAPYPVFFLEPGLAPTTALEPSREVAPEVLG